MLIAYTGGIGCNPKMALGKQHIVGGVIFIVALLIIGILTANLAPIFITEIGDVDTTGWGDGESALWGILGLLFVVAIVMYVIALALQAADVI